MKNFLSIITATAALCLCLAAQAADKAAAGTPREAVATDYNTITAKVLSIDPATRRLTLENDIGEKTIVRAGPEVKNFNNIKKGDQIKVQTKESLVLMLSKASPGEKPSVKAATLEETAPAGQKPAVEKINTLQITAEITKVSEKHDWVELKGPEGNKIGLRVKEPKKLEGLKKGDMVSATYTESMAISVEPMPAKTM